MSHITHPDQTLILWVHFDTGKRDICFKLPLANHITFTLEKDQDNKEKICLFKAE